MKVRNSRARRHHANAMLMRLAITRPTADLYPGSRAFDAMFRQIEAADEIHDTLDTIDHHKVQLRKRSTRGQS